MTKIWGPAAWYFFHAFAEKIDPDFYIKNRKKCFDIIKNICNIIPCPVCKRHALSFLRNINPRTLSTKNDFRKFLFKFHNHSNIITNKTVQNISILDKYKKGTMLKFLKYFNQNFIRINHYSNRFMFQLAAKKLYQNIFVWIMQNSKYFN